MSQERDYWCETCEKEYPEGSTITKRFFKRDTVPSRHDVNNPKLAGVIIKAGTEIDSKLREGIMWYKFRADTILKYYCPKKHEVSIIRLTADRCPVCKQKGDKHDYSGNHRFRIRPENSPCGPCVREMEHLRKIEKQYTALMADHQPYLVTHYPLVSNGGAHTWNEKEVIEKAWRSLVAALGKVPTERITMYSSEAEKIPKLPDPKRPDRSGGDVVLLFSPAVAEALVQLWAAWNALPGVCWDQGLQRGSDLLLQLADGKITGGEFDEDRRMRYSPQKEGDDGSTE